MDDRLRLNITTFYSDYTDLQYQFFAQFFDKELDIVYTRSVVSNAAAAEIKGVELETFYEPIDSLTLSVSVGLTDAEYTGADERGGPLALESELIQTPEWSYALVAEYGFATSWGSQVRAWITPGWIKRNSRSQTLPIRICSSQPLGF